MSVDIDEHPRRALQFELLRGIGPVFLIRLKGKTAEACQPEQPGVTLQAACGNREIAGFQSNAPVHQILGEARIIQGQRIVACIAVADARFQDEIPQVDRGSQVQLGGGKSRINILAGMNILGAGRKVDDGAGLGLIHRIQL